MIIFLLLWEMFENVHHKIFFKRKEAVTHTRTTLSLRFAELKLRPLPTASRQLGGVSGVSKENY